MPLTIRIVVIAFSLLFFLYTVNLVARKRLQLKYSLIWMLLSLVALICGLFPEIVMSLSALLQFISPSNLVFFIALFFLFAISLSLSVIVSWQAHYIKNLVQDVALLNKRIDDADE